CWFGCSTRAGAQRALPSFPTRRSSDLGGARLPRWDIPARMAVTTGLVLLLTSLAPAVGPRLAGLLATFPLYAAILTVFAHDLEGDRKSTRLNSSHQIISYAVFCLKTKQ